MSRRDSDHPPDFSLSQYVDGKLDASRHEEVARHIEACDRCRAEVRFFEELREATRRLDFEHLSPPDVADAVIRRRRAGERGQPASVVARGAAPPRHRYTGVAAAALAFVAVLSAYLLLAPTATATRGELSFGAVPDVPGAVPVDYQPAYYLADEDSLRLRARVYAAFGAGQGGREGTIREVTLRRGGNGRFTGRLPLQAGDVFAVAAVEDFEGVDLDTNFGRLWELHVALEGGEPSFAALESHYRTLEAYNPVLAREWAELITEKYPDGPLGWALSYRNLLALEVDPVRNSGRAFHREKLAELVRAAGAGAGPSELWWLSLYAGYLDEAALVDSLLGELADREPDHPAILNRRVLEAMQEFEFGTPELVARLEELWSGHDRASEFLIHAGVQAAAAGRERTARTWLDRGLQHGGIDPLDLAVEITPYPRLADERARLLRLRLAELESQGEKGRSLRNSVPEHVTDRRNNILRLRVALADALMDAGEEATAAQIYEETADWIWRAEDVGPYVKFLLARGDTAAAMPTLGLLAADPIDGDRALATYSEMIDLRTDDVESFIDRSRTELARRILASLPAGPKLRNDTRVSLSSGEEMTAREYFADRPTVLLFWDARLDRGLSGLDTFEELASRKWVEGIRSAVVLWRPFDSGTITVDTDRLQVLVDSEQELRRQVRDFAVPIFAVVDPQLAVVATTVDAAVALRIAKSLTWKGPGPD